MKVRGGEGMKTEGAKFRFFLLRDGFLSLSSFEGAFRKLESEKAFRRERKGRDAEKKGLRQLSFSRE